MFSTTVTYNAVMHCTYINTCATNCKRRCFTQSHALTRQSMRLNINDFVTCEYKFQGNSPSIQRQAGSLPLKLLITNYYTSVI